MSEFNIAFNDRKNNNKKFCKTKKLFKIDDIDVDKMLISEKRALW